MLEYYRAWQEEGYFYTQTELCSGGNLKNLLEQLEDPTPALPESTVWYVLPVGGVVVGVWCGLCACGVVGVVVGVWCACCMVCLLCVVCFAGSGEG